MQPSILVKVIAIVVFSDIAQARHMNFTAISSSFNNKYLSNLTTWTENGTINMEMISIKQMGQGMRLNIAIQMRIENSAKYQTLFSYDVDVCNMMSGNFGEHLVRNWFRTVLKYANLMEHCPVIPDKYYVRNFRFESNNIPVFLRPGDYRIILVNYFGKRKTKNFEMICRLLLDMKFY